MDEQPVQVEVTRNPPDDPHVRVRLTCSCGTASTYEGYAMGYHVCPGCQRGWEVETLIFFATRADG